MASSTIGRSISGAVSSTPWPSLLDFGMIDANIKTGRPSVSLIALSVCYSIWMTCPSVITLSRAAFRVLLDIYPVLKPDGNFGTDIDGVIKRMGWPNSIRFPTSLSTLTTIQEAMIDPHPLYAMVAIGIAITIYHQITDSNARDASLRGDHVYDGARCICEAS
jgi:hypothetical protein